MCRYGVSGGEVGSSIAACMCGIDVYVHLNYHLHVLDLYRCECVLTNSFYEGSYCCAFVNVEIDSQFFLL